jgi:hypothetical protein
VLALLMRSRLRLGREERLGLVRFAHDVEQPLDAAVLIVGVGCQQHSVIIRRKAGGQ